MSGAAPVQPLAARSGAAALPAVPTRDAAPWSAEEDALLARGARKTPSDASAFAAVAEQTGRSVNAVKVCALAHFVSGGDYVLTLPRRSVAGRTCLRRAVAERHGASRDDDSRPS